MKPKGRPCTYKGEKAEEILGLLARGLTLREICRRKNMPPESTVRLWVLDDREGFAARYARARELQYDTWADEIVEIAEDGTNDWMVRNGGRSIDNEAVQRSRLRVDSRKWLLSKLMPKKYGDRVEHTGADGGELTVRLVDARQAISVTLQTVRDVIEVGAAVAIEDQADQD